ncbi:MAG: helix-turn-helix domain-containing protein [Methanocellales archaeon]|nr:helix-turn-helix domain-containing protein [Methanocellales archaeon]
MNPDLTRLLTWMCAFFAITLTVRFVFLVRNIVQSGRKAIRDVLQQSSGEIFYSDIIERTGFSKARVEILLRSMEKKGMIQRVAHGEDVLIKLIE